MQEERLDQIRAMVLSNTGAKIGTKEMWADRIQDVNTGGIECLLLDYSYCRVQHTDMISNYDTYSSIHLYSAVLRTALERKKSVTCLLIFRNHILPFYSEEANNLFSEMLWPLL